MPAGGLTSGPGGRGVLALQYNRGRYGDIAVAGTSDFGKTWSGQALVAGFSGRVFTPTFAFDDHGNVGLAFYVLDRGTVHLLFGTSDHWSQDAPVFGDYFEVASGPLQRVPAPLRFLGDYQGLTGTSIGFVGALVIPNSKRTGGPTALRLELLGH